MRCSNRIPSCISALCLLLLLVNELPSNQRQLHSQRQSKSKAAVLPSIATSHHTFLLLLFIRRGQSCVHFNAMNATQQQSAPPNLHCIAAPRLRPFRPALCSSACAVHVPMCSPSSNIIADLLSARRSAYPYPLWTLRGSNEHNRAGYPAHRYR